MRKSCYTLATRSLRQGAPVLIFVLVLVGYCVSGDDGTSRLAGPVVDNTVLNPAQVWVIC